MRDIWARGHLSAETFGREMRCSALFAIIFLLFSKSILATVLVSVLIFSNFLISASNKRTSQLMYTYGNVVGKHKRSQGQVTDKQRRISMFN